MEKKKENECLKILNDTISTLLAVRSVYGAKQDSDVQRIKKCMVLKPILFRPLAGYGLPPPRGNFVDHIFLEAQCLARILQHVSPLTMAALSWYSLLHTLPYKIFDN